MPTKARDQGQKELDLNLIKIASLLRDEFFETLQSCTEIHSGASCIKKTQMQRQQWREKENLRKSRHGSWRKSETRKKWSKKQGIGAGKVHFASLMGLCHLKNSELHPQYQKHKGRVVLRGHIVKENFWFVCSVHWTRIISISNDGCKSHGHEIKASRMFRTRSWCSIRFYPGQNGRCINVIKNPKSEWPDIWIRLPRHKWPKPWSSMEDPVVPLERNLCGHPLAGLLWES